MLLKTDIVHESYKTSKGKLAQSFHLGKHTTGVDARGRYPGIYAIDGPTNAGASSFQAPPTKGLYDPLPLEGASHSHGAPRGKRGNSTFLQNACLLASTCSAKMLGSVRPIVDGWLKSFIGMRKIKRKWLLASTFHNLPSMR
jgi:hypothetical protein